MKASSQEQPNSAGLMMRPMTDKIPPTTISTAGSLRQPDKSSGGGKFVLSDDELMSFQFGPFRGRQIVGGSEPAQLQCPQIGHNGPAVFGGDQRAVSAHQAFAVGDRVKNFTIGHLNDALVMQTDHCGHDANLLGDAIAVPQPPVTR